MCAASGTTPDSGPVSFRFDLGREPPIERVRVLRGRSVGAGSSWSSSRFWFRVARKAGPPRTTYVSGGVNITAALLPGRHETTGLAAEDAPALIHATVVPSQTLRQRQVVSTSAGPERRPIPRTIVTILDRTNLVEIRANAKSDAALGDAVQLRVTTR